VRTLVFDQSGTYLAHSVMRALALSLRCAPWCSIRAVHTWRSAGRISRFISASSGRRFCTSQITALSRRVWRLVRMQSFWPLQGWTGVCASTACDLHACPCHTAPNATWPP
ncbi:hypothetical protein FKM82_031219, partial [Ascaphus truei]